MRIKEPRRIIAAMLVVYIVLISFFIMSEILNKSKPEAGAQITGGSVGQVGLNLVSKCVLTLKPELNLVSICANATNLSIGSLLESINGKYEYILRWNASRQEFDTYSPEAAPETNQFTTLETNESYLIYMKEEYSLSISGEEYNDINISLVQEYNTPAYPYPFLGNVTRYISGISGGLSFLSRWNASRQEFDTYSPEAAENPFNTIPKGEGQFVYMIAPAVLSYNKTNLQS